MITVNNQLPTSTLLELKTGDAIKNENNQSGVIELIEITETDEFLMFRFVLTEGEISVRKLKQVC
ncbi:hypothetical protein DBR40_19410 [Pedobacter sp. KBW01]|uniref:hypothetical protein n=1 Tax=Pedobacter sp. KBW01 TaxID=2153364 RepID=UPI000F590C2F|nr:hypothetical protein [Pedobacter sp. KBW01]RQO68416.1 hypothetical protein DBR40_19410 [Pedobacter sp. KBW01]